MTSSQRDTRSSTPEMRLQRKLQLAHIALNTDNQKFMYGPSYDSLAYSEATPLFRSDSDSSSIGSSTSCVGSALRDKLLIAVLVACIVTTLALIGHVHMHHNDDYSLTMLDMELLGSSKHQRAEQFSAMAHEFLGDTKHKTKGFHTISAPEGCEATVLLLRHCEKQSIREHCAYNGYERSVYLSTLFGDGDERWPSPSYIFALAPGQRHNPHKKNFREVETVQPLADKVNLTVDDSFDTKHSSRMAKHILELLRSGELCGKLTVVDWKHSGIPRLAHKLGCGPRKGCPLDYPGASFDEAWEVRFVYKKLWHSTRRNGKIPRERGWEIYGSVQHEGFDPLSFSKQFHDYKPGGTTHGARWSDKAMEVTEGSIKSIEDVNDGD